MKTTLQHPLAAVVITAVVFFSLFAGVGMGHNDEHKNGKKGKRGVMPVENELYRAECGSCHFAYQPGWLPERSWVKLMSQLDKHFGDNAELEAEVQSNILTYLSENSAEKSTYRRSRKMNRSLRSGETPTRITEVPYFERKHDEIPQRLIQGNEQVQSLSHCDKCHGDAEKGKFRERAIKIPGHGRWED
ncbi:MAG: diheme cytochrome c [Gammaproteobacteria bacterium]|nr:diheme cytochrome c [Gammaproteobacteria bacterium]MDH5802347.1 diheme cytochrome c [Gammaproteobacteria bacterium]